MVAVQRQTDCEGMVSQPCLNADLGRTKVRSFHSPAHYLIQRQVVPFSIGGSARKCAKAAALDTNCVHNHQSHQLRSLAPPKRRLFVKTKAYRL